MEEEPDAGRSGAKKRKKTSYQRTKEQHAALVERIRDLEAELAQISTTRAAQDFFDSRNARQALQAATSDNSTLQSLIQQNRLIVATVQSMIPNWLGNESPLSSYIHLGKERAQREQMLQAIKQQKLEAAFQFCVARSRHLDRFKPHTSDERFESARGDFCCSRFEIVQFPGVESAKVVFDALRFVRDNLEIIISESLGHITVREEYDCGRDATTNIANYRLISGSVNGITLEFNEVAFWQLFQDEGGKEYGVVAIDFVDKDDLHPYDSHRRLRKDVSVAIVVSMETPGEQEHDVVVLRRAVFRKVHRPEFDADDETIQEVHNGTTGWGQVMLDAVRRIVYPQDQETSHKEPS